MADQIRVALRCMCTWGAGCAGTTFRPGGLCDRCADHDHGHTPALTIGDSAPEPRPDESWRRPTIGAQTAMDGSELPALSFGERYYAKPRKPAPAETVELWDQPADLWSTDR